MPPCAWSSLAIVSLINFGTSNPRNGGFGGCEEEGVAARSDGGGDKSVGERGCHDGEFDDGGDGDDGGDDDGGSGDDGDDGDGDDGGGDGDDG